MRDLLHRRGASSVDLIKAVELLRRRRVARIKEMTKGIGADSVLEYVGTLASRYNSVQMKREKEWLSGSYATPNEAFRS